MTKRLLAVSLCIALFACRKQDDAAVVNREAMNADKQDLADVDCEKMTTHTVELLVKAKVETDRLSDADAALLADQMAAQHAELVHACVDQKASKPMTKRQYDCYLSKSTITDAATCLM